MNRREILATTGSVGVVAVAGCVKGVLTDKQSATTTSQFSGTVLTVAEVPQSDVVRASNSSKAQFKALMADRQEEFRAALHSDVRNPTAWDYGTGIEYVYYNGTWYSVHVHIVN